MNSMGRKLFKLMGRAIHDYGMLKEGDKILLAVSGGKDSIAMAELFAERKRSIPIKFDLHACHITSNYNCGPMADKHALKDYLENELSIPCEIENIEFDIHKKNGRPSCFNCTWNRRKALFLTADRVGCNKVAFGHHKDDIIQTTLLNLFYHGEISTMPPMLSMFGGIITIIRPMAYIAEKELERYTKQQSYPFKISRCGVNGIDKQRQKMRDLIKELEKDFPYIRSNIFKSLQNIKEDYLN